MSIAFTLTRNGLCEDYVPGSSRWSSFENEAIQGFILSRINKNKINIDPYDGAELSGPALETIIHNAQEALTELQYMPDDLSFSSAYIAFFNNYASPCRHKLTPKEAVELTLKNLIKFAKKAREENERIQFIGD